MTNTAIKTAAALALVAGTLATATFATASNAEAATQTRPAVSAYSKYYYKKAKSQESAIYNWGLKAAANYGATFGKWGQAKGKSMKCSKVQKANKELWRCRATAKPAADYKICKGRVNAKGMFYTKGKKAAESARYNWGLKTAAKYGAKYAKWGKASKRGTKCSRGAKGLVQCTVTAQACF